VRVASPSSLRKHASASEIWAAVRQKAAAPEDCFSWTIGSRRCFVLQSVSEHSSFGITQAGEMLYLDLSARKPPPKAYAPEFVAAVRNLNYPDARGQVGNLGSFHA
jgi:hypothetical protein